MPRRRNKRDPKAIQEVGSWMYACESTPTTAVIGQYADYFSWSDVALQTAVDESVAKAAAKLGKAMAAEIDELVGDDGWDDGGLIEIGGSTDWAKSSLTATNEDEGSVLTVAMIKKAHEELKKKSLKPDKNGNIVYLIPHQKIQLYQYNMTGCAQKLAEVTVDSEGTIC